MERVSVTAAASYEGGEVERGLRTILEPLGGMAAFVQPGETVLIKPNMLSAKPPEAAVTTHPEVLRGVILLVREAGGIPLVGDSPGIGSLARVAEKSGMAAIIHETKAQLVEFADTVEVPGGGTFKRFGIAREYLEADRLINLAKLKTHEMMTMTCAVKNLFGSVVGTAKAGWHLKAGADRQLFARMLLEIYLLRRPELNIVDAVTAMEGDGPGSGDPRHVGLLLAGTNAVAVDVVAAEAVGIPRSLLYVERAAREMGLPGSDPARVETVGGVTLPAVENFRLPHISDVQFGLPRFLKERLRHWLTGRPEESGGCRLCGACVAACPPRALRVDGGRLSFDYHACIRCFCCRELCPHGALAVRDGALLSIIKKFK